MANRSLIHGVNSSLYVSTIHYWHPSANNRSTQLLREAEAHRLEEVTSKLRNQRMEAAERKKEREVKLTDRLPPAKRSRKYSLLVLTTPVIDLRTGTSVNQPKSLFQKAKNEVKLRKSLYTTRMLPPMVQSKTYRIREKPPMPPKGSAKDDNTESLIIKHPPVALAAPSSVSHSQLSDESPVPPSPSKLAPSTGPHSTIVLSPQSSPTQAESRLLKPPIQKKDPMATLFMPKHRAFSQLPSQSKSIK